MADFIRLPVHALRAGNVLHRTGQKVVSVSAGVCTPRGKMDVVLENKDGRRYTATWGRHTLISVRNRDE